MKQLHKNIGDTSLPEKILNLAIVTNIIFEPYLYPSLKKSFSEKDITLDLSYISYNECFSDESCHILQEADYIIVFNNFDELYHNALVDIISANMSADILAEDAINKSKILHNHIKQQTHSPILWFGFEDYCYDSRFVVGNIICAEGVIDRVNYGLYEFLKKQDTYIDLKKLIAHIGIDYAYDSKNKYRWNAPYSKELTQMIANEVYKQYLIHYGITKKCIVLDCDNVLWGGILSEDGIEGIQISNSGLGRSFQDFQRFLLMLYYRGVILAVCSKNDEDDVLRVFKEHSGMILREEHIVCFQVNWNNKPDNIKTISEKLNIGLDSMVFVDDSDFETQSVKSLLPEVVTLKYTRDHIYEQLSCLNLKNNVDIKDIHLRNCTYKTNIKRENLKSQFSSFEGYIKSLEMIIDIHIALPSELERIAELTQRTNKCTNGTRYTVEQLKSQLHKNNDYKLYSISVSDKFSDLGIVGTIGIDNYILDLFSLSCRALGRDVEKAMFDRVKQHKILSVRFASTGKNAELGKNIEKLFTKQCLEN